MALSLTMATDFKFPDVGEGITEGTLVKWRVKLGETIKADAVLCEVETDKAVVELPAPVGGVVLRLHARDGEAIKVGQVLCTIGEVGETVLKTAPGVEATKVNSGPVKEQVKAMSGIAQVLNQVAASTPTGMILAAPRTRQLARDLNVDLSKVNGTGSGGRITDEDVKAAASPIKASVGVGKTMVGGMEMPPAHIPTNLTNLTKSAPTIDGHVERVPIKGTRKAIYERMVRSAFTAPQASAMEDVDVTELVKVREAEKGKAQKNGGVKLTFLPFICKALVEALKEHPALNASVDDVEMELVLKKYYHMGIATDTADGLVVPVVKDVDRKSILQIAKEVQELSQKARDKNLHLEDVRGSSFTISNWGSMGGTYGVPLINYPDVAILGVGRMKETPVVVHKGKSKKAAIEIRWMMPVSLSFDHRVVDGGEAVRFLSKLKEQLEDPYLFLVEVS